MKRSWRIDDKELAYVKESLESGFPGSSCVNFTGRLEVAFAEAFDSRYAISFANGTATLHAALAAAGVEPGDEVIVPPLTMASTSFAVLHQNAVPVFADVDPETFTIDPQSAGDKISGRTKAVIPVALYGLSADMDPLMSLAEERALAVIEDDAQCFLGKYHGRIVGSIGDMSSFSFQNSKHMTCGEGGMVVTSNPDYAEGLRRFSSLGYGLVRAEPGMSKIDKRALVRPDFKRHVSLGFNYRLSEICAAVALAQFEKLETFVHWRRETAAAFEQVVRTCDWLRPQKTPDGYEHSYWAYTVLLDTDEEDLSWQAFYDKFVEFGGDGFYGAWSLTYLEPVFREAGYEAGICPVAERIQPRLVQFKTHYGDRETINREAEAIEKTIGYFA